MVRRELLRPLSRGHVVAQKFPRGISSYGKITKDTETEKISRKAAKAQRFKTKVDSKGRRRENGDRYSLLLLSFPVFGCAQSSCAL